jgi:hypothetical protein
VEKKKMGKEVAVAYRDSTGKVANSFSRYGGT